MFEKLLSLLPYNPGLTSQMAFYSRRMREEASIRRTGMIFLVLAFMIQFFAFMSPPQSTVANSSNDLINGGFHSRSDAYNVCKNNVKHYKDILAYYGITCEKILHNSDLVTIRSDSHNGQLYSMGWNPQGTHNNNTGRPTHEVPVNIPGLGKPVYWRLLDSWGTTSYQALKLHAADGRAFYILFDCGNLVAVGIPPAYTQPCPYNRNIPASSPKCQPPCKYNSRLPANSPLCFDHCPIPGKTNLPKNSPQCFEPCPYNAKLHANDPKCFPPCDYNPQISKDSPDCFERCPYNAALAVNSPECKPCDKSVSSADTLSCTVPHKTASNITTGTTNANNTTAHAGDVIKYTLSVTNNGKKDIEKFIFSENLNDVLDYADATDLHGGTMDDEKQVTWPAETIAPGKTATHEITVKVKDPIPQTPVSKSDPMHYDLTMTNVYGDTVNIKLPGSIPKTVEKISSPTASDLPNTGPGETMALIAAIVVMAAYFYSRSKLLAKESSLALKEMAGA